MSNVVRDVLQHSENSSFTQPLKTNPPVSSVETVSPEPGQVVLSMLSDNFRAE